MRTALEDNMAMTIIDGRFRDGAGLPSFPLPGKDIKLASWEGTRMIRRAIPVGHCRLHKIPSTLPERGGTSQLPDWARRSSLTPFP